MSLFDKKEARFPAARAVLKIERLFVLGTTGSKYSVLLSSRLEVS